MCIAKWISLTVMAFLVTVWLGGSVYIEWAVEYHSNGLAHTMCKTPFRV